MQKKLINSFLSSILLLPVCGQAAIDLPASAKIPLGKTEEVCVDFNPPEWRDVQKIDGVKIQESRLCEPDNPNDIAAFVKGTNGGFYGNLGENPVSDQRCNPVG